jgi:hypothetical protein
MRAWACSDMAQPVNMILNGTLLRDAAQEWSRLTLKRGQHFAENQIIKTEKCGPGEAVPGCCVIRILRGSLLPTLSQKTLTLDYYELT